MTAAFPHSFFPCLFRCAWCLVPCDFVTISIIFLLKLWAWGPIPGTGFILDKLLCHLLWCFLSQHQCCSSFCCSCVSPHSGTSFSPDSLKFLCTLVFAFLWAEVTKHRLSGTGEEAVACLAAQLVQHLLLYHRGWSQPQTVPADTCLCIGVYSDSSTCFHK